MKNFANRIKATKEKGILDFPSGPNIITWAFKLGRRQKGIRKDGVEGEVREMRRLRRACSAIVGFEDVGDHEPRNVISLEAEKKHWSLLEL